MPALTLIFGFLYGLLMGSHPHNMKSRPMRGVFDPHLNETVERDTSDVHMKYWRDCHVDDCGKASQ